jgi:hypothetical protein
LPALVVVGGDELDDAEVHGLLVELQEKREGDPDADSGSDGQEERGGEGGDIAIWDSLPVRQMVAR